MKKTALLIIGALSITLTCAKPALTEESKNTDKAAPPERTVWEFKNPKAVIQVFAKKKPWSAEDAEVLSNLLGFDVSTKTWYYAVIKNLQKDFEFCYEPSDFIVILKDRKQVEARGLSFNSRPFVLYRRKVQDDAEKSQRLIELENMIDIQIVFPEAEHTGVFIFEKDVKENDIYKLYLHYVDTNYLLEKKSMEIKEPEL